MAGSVGRQPVLRESLSQYGVSYTLANADVLFNVVQRSLARQKPTQDTSNVAGQESAHTLHGVAACRLFCQRRAPSRQPR
jgi:hypothetical protein